MNLKHRWLKLQPESQIKIIQYVCYPLLFLLLITPSIVWFSLPNKYSSKNDWLQDFSWAFPVTVAGALFITVVVIMIVNYVRDTKK